MMRLSHLTLCSAIALAVAAPAHAIGAELSTADPGVPADVREQLRRLAEQLHAQQREIERLRAHVEDLELSQRGRGLTAPAPLPDEARPAPVVAAAPPAAPPAAPQEAPLQIGQQQRDEDAQRREQDKALVVREHAPLFERRFTFDAGLSYSYYDRRQLALSGFLALDAIFLGRINLDQSKATLATLDLTGRYGLSDRLSIEANLPFVWRDTRFVSAGAGGASTMISEVHIRSSGIGDASVGAYYQLVKESARAPDIVASLRVRGPSGRHPFGLKLIQPDEDNNNLNVPQNLPTGTGVWSTTANVSALRTYDPVILFGNLGYTWSKPQEFDDISPVLEQVTPARVELGDTIHVSGGLAIALNDRSAVSFSVASALSASTHTRAAGAESQRVPGSSSNVTSLNIGGTYALASGWTLNGQVAAGLTPDAPNFVLGVRASHAF